MGAVIPIIGTIGLKALQRDFRAMIPEAAVETRLMVKEALGPMLAIAKDRAPGSGATIGGPWRAEVRGTSGALVNPHPGARPWEFGGTIAPRGAPIALTPAAHMVWGPGGAIEEGAKDVEVMLIAGFGRLASRHGFTGP